MVKFEIDSGNNNQPLSNTLFNQLQQDILSGKIKSGAKLTEQKLCSEYSVSRTPVREALRQLEMDGLVENIPNRGAFVVGLSEQDVDDMYTLRKCYELQAVEWAIKRISKEELDALQETFEFMEFYTMKKDKEKMLNINTNFHQQIYAATHNRMLQRMLASYQVYIKSIRKTPTSSDEYLATVLEEHRAIFEAFKNHDVEAGIKAMSAHMDNSHMRGQSGKV